ncbi:hypothetical protein EVAR_7237_1 [Eumeta japonica]|uniref:Uncharacterized protein n=1 Tax=Eumeta variegata TaxID=151549 RepID=A0A4C1T2I9_EUMVA|nr:hypothetical protein EVAR_7237_1 [Eumeta japonica]
MSTICRYAAFVLMAISEPAVSRFCLPNEALRHATIQSFANRNLIVTIAPSPSVLLRERLRASPRPQRDRAVDRDAPTAGGAGARSGSDSSHIRRRDVTRQRSSSGRRSSVTRAARPSAAPS